MIRRFHGQYLWVVACSFCFVFQVQAEFRKAPATSSPHEPAASIAPVSSQQDNDDNGGVPPELNGKCQIIQCFYTKLDPRFREALHPFMMAQIHQIRTRSKNGKTISPPDLVFLTLVFGEGWVEYIQQSQPDESGEIDEETIRVECKDNAFVVIKIPGEPDQYYPIDGENEEVVARQREVLLEAINKAYDHPACN